MSILPRRHAPSAIRCAPVVLPRCMKLKAIYVQFGHDDDTTDVLTDCNGQSTVSVRRPIPSLRTVTARRLVLISFCRRGNCLEHGWLAHNCSHLYALDCPTSALTPGPRRHVCFNENKTLRANITKAFSCNVNLQFPFTTHRRFLVPIGCLQGLLDLSRSLCLSFLAERCNCIVSSLLLTHKMSY